MSDLGELYADPLAKIGDLAAAAGLQNVEMLAWRDLDHPEAGGSELHVASIAERWAAGGIDIRLITSRAPGAPRRNVRDGYRIERPAGRYGVFPVAAGRGFVARHIRGRLRPGWPSHMPRAGRAPTSRPDATVEVWNGMPFFSPLWARGPRIVFLHHVHDAMWELVLPRPLAAAGRILECRVAPPMYRGTPIVTLSQSSRQAIVGRLGFRPDQVHVVEPGVDESFRPGQEKHSRPLVVAVGRLVPYKRFDRLIDVLFSLRSCHPDLEAVIAGEGQERGALEALIRSRGGEGWISLPGRIGDDELVELYQRAWVVASASAHEGWGLTITEAAACATPAVVSPIAGHLDAVVDGVSGYAAEPGPEMADRIDSILGDASLRRRMERAAHRRACELSWDRTALETLRILARQM